MWYCYTYSIDISFAMKNKEYKEFTELNPKEQKEVIKEFAIPGIAIHLEDYTYSKYKGIWTARAKKSFTPFTTIK